MKTDGYLFNDMYSYMKFLPQILEENATAFYGNMKYALQDAARRNPDLTIAGFPSPRLAVNKTVPSRTPPMTR